MTHRARESIVKSLFGPGVNSKNRLEALINALPDPPLAPKDFFQIIWDVWPSCDNTFQLNAAIRQKLLDNRAFEPIHSYEDQATSDFYASIPEHFTAYRGCTRLRAKGIS